MPERAPEVNVIGINKYVAAHAPLRKQPVEEKVEKTHRRGEVPGYLRRRQAREEEEEEERLANEPDEDCPEGMVVMAEEERIDTLEVLEESHAELMAALNALPIRIETLGQRTRKAELEDKLREIEDAIRVFSRSKVFVRAE